MSVRFPTRMPPQQLLVAALLVALSASATQAQTAVTWTQGATGNWNTTGNWTGLVPPNLFPNNGGGNTYTVTIPGIAGQSNVTSVVIDNTTVAGNVITISGLTLASALNQFGNNSAELVLGAGATLNAGNLTNFSGTTLSGGRYFIDGTLKFNGANIQTLASGTSLVLNGPAAQILNQVGNVNALSAFSNNQGGFDIRNGYNHTAVNNFANSGIISVSEGSVFTTGANFTNSGTLLASGVSGVGTFNLSNSTINNAGGILNAGNNGSFFLNNTTINGGTLTSSGNGAITFAFSGANVLSGTTLSGTADLATNQGATRVQSGMTFGAGGVINVNNNSVLSFTGDNTIGGTGTIVLGNTGSGNRIAIDLSNSVLTLGSGVTIRGENGLIGEQYFNSTANTSIVNNGKISADVAGGTIAIQKAVVTNNNILEAKNGGTLQFNSAVNGSATSQINASNNGVVRLNDVTITGGNINTSTGGRITANFSGSNKLDGVTVNGAIDLATNQSALRIGGAGVTFGGGDIAINNNSVLSMTGSTSLGGTGTVTFGNTGTGNRFALDFSNTVATIGSGVLVHGHSGSIGGQYFNSSANTSITNNGTISADVSGGTILVSGSTVNNNNVLEAKNGGTLSLVADVNQTATGKIQSSNNGIVSLNGGTITGGTIVTTGTGKFTATGNGANALNDVTLNGAIDLATNQGVLRVNGATGLTLLGGSTVDINNNSILTFQHSQALSGAGSIVFGNSGGANRVAVDITNSVLTIGANASIRGHSGTIGDAYQFSSANTSIVNNGRISADVAGGIINISTAPVTNNGILEAKNGGTLMLSSNVTGGAGSQISAGTGSSVVQNGVTLSGVVNSTGTGSLRSTNAFANILDGVTLTGKLDLASQQSSERIFNGFTLNGTIDLNNNSVLAFQGTQGVAGNGTIVLGNSGGANKIAIDQSNSVVTLGANVKIRGESGTIGQQNFLSSANTSLINNGRISADVAGGTIEMATAAVTNNGIMEALNGGTLKLSSNVAGTSTGQFIAGAGSVILQNGVAVTGTINTSGGGFFRATNATGNVLDGATVNGSVDLATGQGLERVNNGLVLNGNIAVNNNSVLGFQGSQTLSGSGTITLGNTGASNRISVDQSNSVLTIANGVLIHGENGTVGQQFFNSSGNTSIANSGRISADVSGGTITIAQATVSNNGILDAQNGGRLMLTSDVTNSANGQVNGGNNSHVLISGMTMTGGTLNTTGTGAIRATFDANNRMNDVNVNGLLDLATSQGSIRVGGAGMTLGSAGVASINQNSVLSFTGDVLLGGTGSVLFGSSGGANKVALDVSNTRLTVGQGVTIHGVNGSIGEQHFNSTANTHLVNNGTINSDGGGLITVAGNLVDIQNNGTLRAQSGSLTLGQSLTGTGTLQVDAAGIMNMSSNGVGNVQNKLVMGAAGAALNTANKNITINKDYTNVAAGTGNTFNKRAGINGTGQINAGGDAAQAITGANVTGGANNYTMTIGNVRVGTTNFNYQIANTGTVGADLRGAIQTSVNGGNINDPRLSGAGVTAGGYGPIAVGTNSGNQAVGFTVGSAGALASLNGQAVNFRSNFDNIADQKLNIAIAGGAAAYNVAVGNTTSPLILGNTRVGGTLGGNLNVANVAPTGSFTEKLDASFGSTTGGITTNGGAVSLLAAGSTNNTSMGVSFSTATSGAKLGTVGVNYTSNGAGTSGLGTIAAGTQTVNVNGNVYAVAVGQLNSTPLNFGTVQVGQNVSKVLSIMNAGTGAAGFVEDLDVAFGAASGTGSNLISGTGSIAGLLAGATNSSAMTVSVNTANAGSVAGNILVNYTSAGAVNGVSNGLGKLGVGNSQFGVNGTIQAQANVVNQASPVINNAPINLGNVRVGSASPTGFVSVTNQMTTLPQAALNASISGNGSVTASGSFNLLDPGATNSGSLQVGMNTASAGNKSGLATIGFVSDASNIGNCAPNCQMTIASQNVAVNGAVYRLANPTVSSAPINLVARVGDAAPVASIGITNNSPDAFTERLDASFNGAAPTGFTTTGAITGLAAQGSSSALKAALNTSTAGVFSGSAGINLTSSGAGTTNAADFALAPGSASLNGKVYAAAVGLVNTPAVDFGIVHVGDVVAAKNVSVSNSASVVALNDVLKGDITGGNAQFGVNGALGGVAAGNTDNSNLNVSFNTNNAGVYTGAASVNLKSSNADMADLGLGSTSVGLKGTVNNYASAMFAKSSGAGAFSFVNGGWVLDFGSVAANSTSLFASLGVRNSANGPADDLDGSFMFGTSAAFDLTGFGQFTGIGAGSSFGGLGVLFNTMSLGQFSQVITLNSFGSNASGYRGALADLQLTVMGNVTSVTAPPTTTAPEPSTFILMIGGLGVVAWARKRTRRNAR